MALEPRALAGSGQADRQYHNAFGRTRRDRRNGGGDWGRSRRGRSFGLGFDFRLRFFGCFWRRFEDTAFGRGWGEGLRDGLFAATTTATSTSAAAAATALC